MLTESKKKVVELYNNGLGLYKNRQFASAMELFNSALQIDDKDGPSRLYVDRCKHFMETPPPENWDGVFTMTTK